MPATAKNPLWSVAVGIGSGFTLITAAACYGNIAFSKTCVHLADGGIGTQLGSPDCEPCVDTPDSGRVTFPICVDGALVRAPADVDAGDEDAGKSDAGESDAGIDAG